MREHQTVGRYSIMVHYLLEAEIALNFKEQANEYFKGKRYREAIGSINKALTPSRRIRVYWKHFYVIPRLAIWS